MADETQAVQQVISRYHQAITDNGDAAFDCFGPTYLQFGKLEGGWTARFYTHVGAKEFRSRISSGDTPYTNSIEFTDTNISETAATVLTKETGSGGEDSWKGVANLWFIAKRDDGWKIVGSGHYMDR